MGFAGAGGGARVVGVRAVRVFEWVGLGVGAAVVVAALGFAVASGAAAQLAGDVEARDRLIADQENLLNAYRCMFNTDTGAVPGGCPNPAPVTPQAPPPNPDRRDIEARDSLIQRQEALLNAYRCQFKIDLQTVTGGCPADTPQPQPKLMAVDPNPNNIPDYDPDTFHTEENALSRIAKHDIVDKHADEHPWLLATWNWTNRPGFSYTIEEDLRYVGLASRSVIIIDRAYYVGRIVEPTSSNDATKFYELLIHEMAHIYTEYGGSRQIVLPPNAISNANQYFGYYQRDIGCSRAPSHELFADALASSVLELDRPGDSRGRGINGSYWRKCTFRRIPAEALAVAAIAGQGKIPSWFCQTFQKTDGSWDHEALTADLKAAQNPRPIYADIGLKGNYWEDILHGDCQ